MSQTLPPTLDRMAITTLKGVGAAMAEKLAKIGLHTLQDVLFHLPMRYMDRTRITPIGGLAPNQYYVIEARVRDANILFGKRRSLVVRLQDDTGTTSLRFYHFNAGQKAQFSPGTVVRVFGETRRGAAGLEFYHPEYDLLHNTAPPPLQQHLTAVYPATDGLSQARIRTLVEQTLAFLDSQTLRELLPETLRGEYHQAALAEALRYLHQPPVDADLAALSAGEHPYQQRLAFEELLAHHTSLLLLRRDAQSIAAPPLQANIALKQQFMAALPFALTAAQARVLDEIEADIATPIPMLRLVQGDVGSGKTVVAALAALAAVSAGKQAAIMAPTEILAEQHLASFNRWFEPLGIHCAWLTGKLKVSERRQQLAQIETGSAQIIVGTHALFQDAVEFHDLGLIIIDEQHRFGVHQRLSLREKGAFTGKSPHQLIMTATPIPRTLAMSAYADLDCSVIDELPPGRTPVSTVVISHQRRLEVIERVRAACREGRQAYWVCTLIEESETLSAQAAEATAEILIAALPELCIGLIHGRLKSQEKEAVMAAFKARNIDLLVATTVIEVGVDVPNASLMIIENPERLGLAQLHQLRGRVGRGSAASHCVLLYQDPLSAQGRARLGIMRETNDGFVIAEQDLLLRGAGEVLGTRQTGDMQFRMANLDRDGHLLPQVKACAMTLLADYPERSSPLINRWLGHNHIYVNA